MKEIDIKIKLQAISKIGLHLNEEKVLWAVGGSTLLYFKGITEDFNDIDIMIDEKNIEITKKILYKIGFANDSKTSIRYKTRCFMEFTVDDVDIDIMAGFTVLKDNKKYYLPLKKEDIESTIFINDVKIPLQSLEKWRYYYYLMDRTEKVKMIDNFLNKLK